MQDEGTFLEKLLEYCEVCDTYLHKQLKRCKSTKRRMLLHGQIKQVDWFRNQVKGYLMLYKLEAQEHDIFPRKGH